MNFNPRSREGSDIICNICGHLHCAFQSTLPRRERRNETRWTRQGIYHFNPRSREGSDLVSLAFSYLENDFNPRSREGSDPQPQFDAHADPYFNPRSREGSDTGCFMWAVSITYFNPRSREGSDLFRTYHTNQHVISIHAPAKGATKWSNVTPSSNFHFNPRSREGSDSIY